jgi:hypothetical protein
MKKTIFALAFLAGIFITLAAETFPVPQLPFEPRSYACMRAPKEIRIDGNLDEPAWIVAPWTEPFTDIEGALRPAPYLNTRVKMLWNDRGLYVAAVLKEPQIWANLTERDDIIFFDNDFEIFIDPDGDSHEYYELEMNALGTLWDLFIEMPYRDEHTSLNGWNIPGGELAIGVEGSVNDPSDTDKEWDVEMLLPWKAFEEFAHGDCPPKPGDFWRINFSRVEWETEVQNGKYVKIPDKSEHNWVWSPQGLVAMHYPERWGYVFFSDKVVGTPGISFVIPEAELAKQYLYRLYYAEKQYWMNKGSFTNSLRKLRQKPVKWQDEKIKPLIETTSQSFVITLRCPGLPVYLIDHQGRLTELK